VEDAFCDCILAPALLISGSNMAQLAAQELNLTCRTPSASPPFHQCMQGQGLQPLLQLPPPLVPSPANSWCLKPEPVPQWLCTCVCTRVCLRVCACVRVWYREQRSLRRTCPPGITRELPSLHGSGLPRSLNWGPVPLDIKVRAHLFTRNIST